MASSSAISGGGVSGQPWESPALGGTGTGTPSQPPPLASGTSQSGGSGGSTGVGGIFAEWPGQPIPNWPRKGLFGGWGDRGTAR